MRSLGVLLVVGLQSLGALLAVALLLLWTAVFTDSIAAEGDSDTVTLINSDEALPGFDYVKDVRVSAISSISQRWSTARKLRWASSFQVDLSLNSQRVMFRFSRLTMTM